jgi:hypothetical protein
MPIFSRRTIQRMLNENAGFLAKGQLGRHVYLLNREDFQSLVAEWEVAVLNAFSKLGKVEHEPDLGGTARLDLLFTPTHHPGVSIAADVATVSDEGYEEENPVRDFYVELTSRIAKAGIPGNGFNLTIQSRRPPKFGENPKVMLPPRGDFAREIFNADFRAFLRKVKEHPQQPASYFVHTARTSLQLTYTPGQRYFMSHYATYNRATSKKRNPVFNALKLKTQKQLKRVHYSGPKGIILCDGGSNMPNPPGHYSSNFNYNAEDAIKEFLRQNQSVDFVLMISSVWTEDGLHRPWEGRAARTVRVSVVGNKSFDSLPAAVRESMAALEQHFPVPTNTSAGARETLRYRYDSKESRPLAGGLREVNHNQIKLSANAVLALLAGAITQEEFFKAMGFKPWSDEPHAYRNSFEYMLSKKMRIAGVQVEETEHDDDDTLVFNFDGPDPARSPFINPKAKVE